jgi:hypothetical protein
MNTSTSPFLNQNTATMMSRKNKSICPKRNLPIMKFGQSDNSPDDGKYSTCIQIANHYSFLSYRFLGLRPCATKEHTAILQYMFTIINGAILSTLLVYLATLK